ncbi:MAG: radical SAM protein, partial [Halanaerobiaceae bacterium]|nr:radical SAM protein [Halanaerobiaceae bacterium]
MKWKIEDPYIEITSLCNLKCIHCYNSSSSNTKKHLNISELEQCLSYFNEIGIKQISVSGGEPLLYPNLMELLEICSFYEMEVFLVTNGTLLNNDLVSKIRKHIKYYQVSLDGDRDTNDTLRGVGSYDK